MYVSYFGRSSVMSVKVKLKLKTNLHSTIKSEDSEALNGGLVG